MSQVFATFDNTYAKLPPRMYARVNPTAVRAPSLIKLNVALAEELGLDAEALASEEGVRVLSGNAVPEGADPIALAYAGHQFGSFVHQLGDGRAILLGEVVGRDGKRRDIQLKGSGRTPFSRGGDGRAAFGPVLREYLISEAMAALSIPTTRSLAAVATGEPVIRDQVLRGAVLTRVAASHIRVGTFEYFAARDDREALELLVRQSIERHYPDIAPSDSPALALLDRVIGAQAKLVARWLGVGFIHGVMNTDNTSISGETIDYGPCAFLDAYDPNRAFSSIDRGRRYAFMNQPKMALFNLTRLAEALLPVLADEEEVAVSRAESALSTFSPRFDAALLSVMRQKLGLAREVAEDGALVVDLFERMASNEVDFTLFFRWLSDSAESPDADSKTAALFSDSGAFQSWAEEWRRRLAAEEARSPEARARAMKGANPAFIPRNHRVEEALAAAAERDDMAPFERLLVVLARPYDDQPEHAELMEPASASEQSSYKTFCGT